jgi:hypothetical protein
MHPLLFSASSLSKTGGAKAKNRNHFAKTVRMHRAFVPPVGPPESVAAARLPDGVRYRIDGHTLVGRPGNRKRPDPRQLADALAKNARSGTPAEPRSTRSTRGPIDYRN